MFLDKLNCGSNNVFIITLDYNLLLCNGFIFLRCSDATESNIGQRFGVWRFHLLPKFSPSSLLFDVPHSFGAEWCGSLGVSAPQVHLHLCGVPEKSSSCWCYHDLDHPNQCCKRLAHCVKIIICTFMPFFQCHFLQYTVHMYHPVGVNKSRPFLQDRGTPHQVWSESDL